MDAHDQMVLDFVRLTSATCPKCGYNLEALASPTCPECGAPLRLSLHDGPRTSAWWTASVVSAAAGTGFFFFLSAWFGVLIIFTPLGLSEKEWTLIPGLLSSAASLAWLLKKRRKFCSMRASKQRWSAVGVVAANTLVVLGALIINTGW